MKVFKKAKRVGQWWQMPLISVLGGRGRRISESKASLVCITNSKKAILRHRVWYLQR